MSISSHSLVLINTNCNATFRKSSFSVSAFSSLPFVCCSCVLSQIPDNTDWMSKSICRLRIYACWWKDKLMNLFYACWWKDNLMDLFFHIFENHNISFWPNWTSSMVHLFLLQTVVPGGVGFLAHYHGRLHLRLVQFLQRVVDLSLKLWSRQYLSWRVPIDGQLEVGKLALLVKWNLLTWSWHNLLYILGRLW